MSSFNPFIHVMESSCQLGTWAPAGKGEGERIDTWPGASNVHWKSDAPAPGDIPRTGICRMQEWGNQSAPHLQSVHTFLCLLVTKSCFHTVCPTSLCLLVMRSCVQELVSDTPVIFPPKLKKVLVMQLELAFLQCCCSSGHGQDTPSSFSFSAEQESL